MAPAARASPAVLVSHQRAWLHWGRVRASACAVTCALGLAIGAARDGLRGTFQAHTLTATALGCNVQDRPGAGAHLPPTVQFILVWASLSHVLSCRVVSVHGRHVPAGPPLSSRRLAWRWHRNRARMRKVGNGTGRAASTCECYPPWPVSWNLSCNPPTTTNAAFARHQLCKSQPESVQEQGASHRPPAKPVITPATELLTPPRCLPVYHCLVS
jgi:hypothetical protein